MVGSFFRGYVRDRAGHWVNVKRFATLGASNGIPSRLATNSSNFHLKAYNQWELAFEISARHFFHKWILPPPRAYLAMTRQLD